jgi:hypothetical protein
MCAPSFSSGCRAIDGNPPNWQRVTALLLSAARTDEVDVADVTVALEMAASMDEGPPKPEPK